MSDTLPEVPESSNFIEEIIIRDLESGKITGGVVTRFPPEPNGYLHIGHAKSICLNFGIAGKFKGKTHLRFDDTNPMKEDMEYVESIKEDVRWLGFSWGDNLFHASDYFEKLYQIAELLIKKGKAYVDSLSADEIREYRGTLTSPGKESPYRNRTIEENLDLFRRMRAGEFTDGAHVLRAKIDMASGNIVMRDPTLYRIRKTAHQATGDRWCIYPMYDFTHCLSDSIEGITHSICTLEFENNRPLYDWVVEAAEMPCHPRQIEFARLNLTYTVMSKRKLLELVEKKYVSGWDDPRMPTIRGLRRRGFTPEAIRDFCDRIGVAKRDSMVDYAFLEHCLREDLNKRAPRVMAVLKPLKLVIDNYPEGSFQELDAVNNPEDPQSGSRKIPFGREIYIEEDDFRETPPPKYFRLAPGQEVRLKFACYVKCTGVVKNEAGTVTEVHCTYDPETIGGWSKDGRKVKGTIHWVSAAHAIDAEVRLYDQLFTAENLDAASADRDYKEFLNPASLEVLTGCKVEPALAKVQPGSVMQFERIGYFCADNVDFRSDRPVFNRTVTLKDTWARIEKNAV